MAALAILTFRSPQFAVCEAPVSIEVFEEFPKAASSKAALCLVNNETDRAFAARNFNEVFTRMRGGGAEVEVGKVERESEVLLARRCLTRRGWMPIRLCQKKIGSRTPSQRGSGRWRRKGTCTRRRRWVPEAALENRRFTRNEFELLRERGASLTGIRYKKNFGPIYDRWG